MEIKTGSWYAPVPADHIKIGVSRGVPRGMPAGYRTFKKLAPGLWFNSVGLAEYLERYNAILAGLDPKLTWYEIKAIAGDKTPVLCCYESAPSIQAGTTYCHRHMAAQWLEQTMGITIQEIGAPDNFDRWAMARKEGITPPSYR